MRLLLIFLLPIFGYAQVMTSPIENLELEIQHHFMGEGVWTNQIQLIGHPNAIARFETGVVGSVLQEYGFVEGIFISTGTAFNDKNSFIGPNTTPNFGANNATEGIASNFPTPYELMGSQSYDAAGLQFQLTTLGDTLWFDFIFASEEYNEYVGSQFNDYFVLYMKEVTETTYVNVAKLDNQSIISVNKINNGQNNDGPCLNCTYYVYNGNGIDQEPYVSNPYFIQFDGFTKPISLAIPVVPGNLYDIRMMVSDVNDPIFDSGVFLKKGSIKTNALAGKSPLATFSVFPNPNGGQFTIQSTFVAQRMRVFSSQGQVLLSRELDATRTQSIDLSHFARGIYLIELVTEAGSVFEYVSIE